MRTSLARYRLLIAAVPVFAMALYWGFVLDGFSLPKSLLFATGITACGLGVTEAIRAIEKRWSARSQGK